MLPGTDFRSDDFQAIRFPYESKIILSSSYLSGILAPGFNLRNANLRNANLGGADLRNADLRNANLEYVIHLGSSRNLEYANIYRIKIDEDNRKIVEEVLKRRPYFAD